VPSGRACGAAKEELADPRLGRPIGLTRSIHAPNGTLRSYL
jgi:hypothetical protein